MAIDSDHRHGGVTASCPCECRCGQETYTLPLVRLEQLDDGARSYVSFDLRLLGELLRMAVPPGSYRWSARDKAWIVRGGDSVGRLIELLEMIHVGVQCADPVNNEMDRLIASSRQPPTDPPEAVPDPPKRRLQLV